MKEFLIIKDPVVARLFADKTRRNILHNLRHKEMTSYQLAKLLEKNVSSISYHINTLEKANLIEKTKSSIKGNLVEKYYLATAHKFIISYTLSEGLISGSDDIAKWSKEVCKRALDNLQVFHFDVSIEKRDKLLKLIEKYSTFNKIALEEVVSQQNKPFHANRPSLRLLLSLLTNLQLYNNTKFREIMDILSDILWKDKKGV